MYYGGLDAHKTYLTLVVDREGEEVHRERRIPVGDGGPLLEALADFRPLEVVVESCPFWQWIHDLLMLNAVLIGILTAMPRRPIFSPSPVALACPRG